MGKKIFWSRDRLVKHEFYSLGNGLAFFDCKTIKVKPQVTSELVRANIYGFRPVNAGS